MAQKIQAFPKTTRRSKYDTKSWFDGNVWKLTQGEDFTVDVASFRGSLYNSAKREQIAVKTTVDNSGDKVALILQKVGNRPSDAPAKKTAKSGSK